MTATSIKKPMFDYVIVGGGSAGCVAANRLSAPGHTVCLIEAGKDLMHEDAVRRADNWVALAGMQEYHWEGMNTPAQKGLADREFDCSQARMAGGCGSHNASQYVRGSPFDYNGWAKEYGCGDQWTWEQMLPYFQGLETYAGAGATRGTSGELQVREVFDLTPAGEAFVQTAKDNGMTFNQDYNNGTQYGISKVQTNVTPDGSRHSPFDAFVRPLMEGGDKQRDNLEVRLETTVGRVLFEGTRATGVEIIDRPTGKPTGEVIYASKDVILACSALQSPKVLLLSGVGPKEHLESVGIPVVHDSPCVGKNLSDHLLCPFIFKFTDAVTNPGLLCHPFTVDWSQLHMFAAKDGTQNEHRPDWQALFAARSTPLEGYPLPEGAEGEEYKRTFFFFLCQSHPESRGSVMLQSKDPSQPPLVDPQYLSDPADLEMWSQMIQWMRDLLGPFLEKYPAEELAPAGAGITDDLTWVQNVATTMWHPCGTLAMGGGKNSVVDPQTMKVKGVDGLRVLDASVIPETPSGNTNVPVMATAARGADLILKSASK